MPHPLPPRPLRPRPQRGLRLGGCRDGACRPSPYPPGTGRNPPTSVCRTVPSCHSPGTGACVSSSQSSGVYFPPAPRGKDALMMFWTLIPATSPPLLRGRKQAPMLCNATGTFLPAPSQGEKSRYRRETRGSAHSPPLRGRSLLREHPLPRSMPPQSVRRDGKCHTPLRPASP